MTALCLFLLAAAGASVSAVDKDAEQTVEEYRKEATIQVGFLIAKSTPDYSEALAAAKSAAESLRLPLRLRDLVPNKKTGLTYPRVDCEREVGEDPCYFLRARAI